MNVLLDFLKLAVAHLDRPALATVGRKVLLALAAEAEGATTNQIVEGAEVVGFGELDALLAKIAAGPAPVTS